MAATDITGPLGQFLLTHSPISCLSGKPFLVSVHKLPGTIKKLPDNLNWASIKHFRAVH
jgi:hypothetical protein